MKMMIFRTLGPERSRSRMQSEERFLKNLLKNSLCQDHCCNSSDDNDNDCCQDFWV